jgi:antirestriction protein ArdC
MDVYRNVTEKIVDLLECGVVPWRRLRRRPECPAMSLASNRIEVATTPDCWFVI